MPRAMVMSVVWSALFGYLFLAAFILMIPDMDQAAAQGWNVFFWAFDQQVNSGSQGVRLSGRLRRAAPVRSGNGDLGVAHDLRLLPRRRLARLGRARQGQPDLPHAGSGDLDRFGSVGAVRVGFFAGFGRRHLRLHDRCLLHGHLPVPVLHLPDRARHDGLGNTEVGQDGSVEPRARAYSCCSACCLSCR